MVCDSGVNGKKSFPGGSTVPVCDEGSVGDPGINEKNIY